MTATTLKKEKKRCEPGTCENKALKLCACASVTAVIK